MACSITKVGINFIANIGAQVTVAVVADNTKMTGANYAGKDLSIDDFKSAQFTVVKGPKLLLVNLAGPQEDVAIVEDCGGDQTQAIGGYSDDFQPVLGFTIDGK